MVCYYYTRCIVISSADARTGEQLLNIYVRDKRSSFWVQYQGNITYWLIQEIGGFIYIEIAIPHRSKCNARQISLRYYIHFAPNRKII